MRIELLEGGLPAETTRHLSELWGSTRVASRGAVHDLADLPAFVAVADDGSLLGLSSFRIDAEGCELVSLEAFERGCGVGSALFDATVAHARAAGCATLWLVTTNDNTPALRFYQRRGMHLVARRTGAVREARLIKPEIPLLGFDDLPIEDEIELALELEPESAPVA